MKEPVHNVKRQVKRNLDKSYHWSEPFQVYGWLGSGVKDVNGNEIFEGDIVRHEIWEKDLPVTFHDGAFWLGDTDCPLCYQFGKLLEINGHIEKEGDES